MVGAAAEAAREAGPTAAEAVTTPAADPTAGAAAEAADPTDHRWAVQTPAARRPGHPAADPTAAGVATTPEHPAEDPTAAAAEAAAAAAEATNPTDHRWAATTPAAPRPAHPAADPIAEAAPKPAAWTTRWPVRNGRQHPGRAGAVAAAVPHRHSTATGWPDRPTPAAGTGRAVRTAAVAPVAFRPVAAPSAHRTGDTAASRVPPGSRMPRNCCCPSAWLPAEIWSTDLTLTCRPPTGEACAPSSSTVPYRCQ